MFDWGLFWEIAKILLSAGVGAWLFHRFEKRAHLVAYVGHMAHHKIDESNLVLTWSVVLRNTGRLASHNVQIKHKFHPDNFEIRPSRQYALESVEDGGVNIVFDKVVPQEELTISYLRLVPKDSTTDPGIVNRGISCDEGYPQVLNYFPMRVYPRRVNQLLGALVLIGSVASIYLLIEFSIWIAKLITVVSGG